jgi:hypothetical protein
MVLLKVFGHGSRVSTMKLERVSVWRWAKPNCRSMAEETSIS